MTNEQIVKELKEVRVQTIRTCDKMLSGDEEAAKERAMQFCRILGLTSMVYKKYYSAEQYPARFYSLINTRFISGDCCYDFVKGYENSSKPDNFITQRDNSGCVVIDKTQNHAFAIAKKRFDDRDFLKDLCDEVIRFTESKILNQP